MANEARDDAGMLPAPAPSRQSVVAWTLSLLISNLFLFAWLFRETAPWDYISRIYFSKEEVPFVYGLPAVMLVLSGVAGWLKFRRPLFAASVVNLVSAKFFFAIALIIAGGILNLIFGSPFVRNFYSFLSGFGIVLFSSWIGERTLTSWPFRISASRFDSLLELKILSSSLGLGLLSIIVFGVGTIYVWQSIPFLQVSIALMVVFFPIHRDREKNPYRWRVAFRGCEHRDPLSFSMLAFVAALFAVHLPLLFSAPTEYDTLEYHLAGPAQYLADGRITFLNENLYANFAQNAEMLYLLAMQVAGDRFGGVPCAHAILLSAWMLSVGGVYVLARRLAKSIPVWGSEAAEIAPAFAALLYALIPLGSQLAADFYIEHFQALFHICALLCACAFLSEFKVRAFFERNTSAPADPAAKVQHGWLLAAGLFAGLGSGTKYPALLFTLAPLMIFLPLCCLLLSNARSAWSALWRIAVPAMIVFSPWAARNFAASGDPFYPLGLVLMRRIAGASGLPDKLDHFEAAHRAGESSLRTFFDSIKQLMPGVRKWPHIADVESGPQLCAFAVPGFACVSSVETAFVAFVFIADLVIWFLFTHRLNRFFYPHLSVLAALGGLGAAALWRVKPLRKICVLILAAFILLFTPLQLFWPWIYASRESSGLSTVDEARAQFKFLGAPQSFEGIRAAAEIQPSSSVLFVGEAQTFYAGGVPNYSVVFNVSILETLVKQSKTSEELRAHLKQRGITHLYFNYSEWMRLDTTYSLGGAEGRAHWNLARWSPEQSQELAGLLRVGSFKAYAEHWPEDIFPAYMKLTAAQYELLEKFFSQYTRRVWPAADAPFWTCELRSID